MEEVFRTQQPGWQARVDEVREAEVPVANGAVRQGVDFRIGLMCDGQVQSIQVRAVFAADLSPEARADQHYQQQSVLRHVFTRLEAGWTPDQGSLPPIVIRNPHPEYKHPDPSPRPSVIDRLLRRR
ncbi:MAG TPA: hypothetical protein VE650_15855 [Acetobacteraceae bacterium]|nr:hypothetical protein [Acetobacteraceae bacterium]